MAKRGFAAMTPEMHRALASRGGKKAHALGKAHTWQAGAEAKTAGRKGGFVKHHGKHFEPPAPVAVSNTAPVPDVHEHELSRFSDEGNPND